MVKASGVQRQGNAIGEKYIPVRAKVFIQGTFKPDNLKGKDSAKLKDKVPFNLLLLKIFVKKIN